MSKTHTTTTDTLTDYEIVQIAKSMGLRQTGYFALRTTTWEIAGYTIVERHEYGSYSISIDGHHQTAGTGNIVDALRAFIGAGE